MAYLTDSDWLIDYLAELPEADLLFSSLLTDGVFMSAITYMEAFQGTLRTRETSAREKLRSLSVDIPVLPVNVEVAERCARIRQGLLDEGKRPTRRGFDILVAATAIEYNLTLVTRNVRDYADIPGVKLYDSAAQA